MTPTAGPPRNDGASRSRRPFVALVAAGGVSTVGSTVSYVAIPWFVLVTTGSLALAGVAGTEMTYELHGRRWAHALRARILDETELAAATAASDLRFAGWLDRRAGWFRAEPC